MNVLLPRSVCVKAFDSWPGAVACSLHLAIQSFTLDSVLLQESGMLSCTCLAIRCMPPGNSLLCAWYTCMLPLIPSYRNAVRTGWGDWLVKERDGLHAREDVFLHYMNRAVGYGVCNQGAAGSLI